MSQHVSPRSLVLALAAGLACGASGCSGDDGSASRVPFDDCASDPHATAESLGEKAARFDELAARLHVHPRDQRLHTVTIRAGVDPANATFEDVVDWHLGENDGLWTGLYIASQAFRWAATHDPDALANLRTLTEGFVRGMRITGVPGVFTREYVTPGIEGMACPADPLAYAPDAEKDDNRWVRVDADGTIVVYDVATAAFVRTTHRVPPEYAGYCWLDDVSKDEYAGHLLALAALVKLVDDPEVHDAAADLATLVAEHVATHDMAVTDWDGRLVEHGRLWPLALDDWPDFNAILGLEHVKLGAVASGRADLADYYRDCLLQRSGRSRCIDQPLATIAPFDAFLGATGLYTGRNACKANWNNFGMQFTGAFALTWFEEDPALRALLQDHLANRMYRHHDNVREMAKQQNAAWAILTAAGTNLDRPAVEADRETVEMAVCALRQFPASKAIPTLDVGEDLYPTDGSCESRFEGRYLTVDPVPVWQRCPGTFTWWSNPYAHHHCEADPQTLIQPADYLLPYWMARYYGYVGAG